MLEQVSCCFFPYFLATSFAVFPLAARSLVAPHRVRALRSFEHSFLVASTFHWPGALYTWGGLGISTQLGVHQKAFLENASPVLVLSEPVHSQCCPQVNEVKGSIKFQLKKVLCLGVAIGHVGMEENQIRGMCPGSAAETRTAPLPALPYMHTCISQIGPVRAWSESG